MSLATSAEPARRRFRGEIAALQAIVVVFLLLRAYFDLNADLFGDETYYWMWGQHLSWSYFDHPPLHAWLLRLVAMVAGWHPLSVRLLTWLTLAGVFVIFRDWARRLAPADPDLWFWRSAAIYLSSPLFFGMTMIAYHDHLLVFLSLLAVHCFVLFIDKHETGAPRPLLWLYLAAAALGLAMLTKYNGIFVGFGFLAAFALRPGLRPLLRTPHPYLAALLALVLQTPVIWWNLTEGLASFHYHLSDRWGGHAGQLSWFSPVLFILLCALIWSPFLVWPLVKMLRGKPESNFDDRARTLTLSTFTISTLSLTAIAIPLGAFFYWNIVGLVGLMPLVQRFVGKWLGRLHYAFGLLCAGLIVANFTLTPVAPALIGLSDRGSSINFGWNEVAGHIRLAEANTPTDMVAATRYSTTSQLGFALGIADAVKLSPEHSQYDYWQAGLPLTGKSAIVLTDENDGSGVITWLHGHFTTLTQVDSFDIVRFGKPIYNWRLFRGEDFKP
jgi:4-amino-4-deoxy-L-arabinose transferase-like glycosyltransferase